MFCYKSVQWRSHRFSVFTILFYHDSYVGPQADCRDFTLLAASRSRYLSAVHVRIKYSYDRPAAVASLTRVKGIPPVRTGAAHFAHVLYGKFSRGDAQTTALPRNIASRPTVPVPTAGHYRLSCLNRPH